LEYTALWGPKGFIISPSKIVPLMDLTTGFAVKTDNSNDTSRNATVNTRGKELQTLSLSTLYVRGAGVDPRGQIAEWEAQVGNAYPLYIEGKRFGPNKLMLKSVDVSDILLSNTGKMLQCAIAVKFEEFPDGKATSATRTTTAGNEAAKRAAETYNSITTQKRNALNATANASDRAAKKPTAKATGKVAL
jgi:hypothetical protein